MSAKCYSFDAMPISKENISDHRIVVGKSESKEKKINKLLEYEKLASMAEQKCVRLRSELERVKQICNTSEEKNPQPENASQIHHNTQPHKPTESFENILASKIVRQNSKAIGTDTTGAALNTINSIIDGITDSIQFHKITETDENKDDTASKTPRPLPKTAQGIQQIKLQTKTNNGNASKIKSPKTELSEDKKSSIKSTISKCTINRLITRQKKIFKRDKRVKINTNKSVVIERSFLSEARRNLRGSKRGDFVEIYHNIATKASDSSEITTDQMKKPILVPPLKISDGTEKSPLNCSNTQNPTYLITRRRSFSAGTKHYESPTISSKLKRAAKCLLNTYNVKSIPFCPASSIGPSHNVGINIQQVMSMLKNRQPVKGISSTIAYNMGLVAEKWQSSTLPALTSNLTSRGGSKCPLTASCNVNYRQMQEMARFIPDEMIEEIAEENDENDEKKSTVMSTIITGPSGDVRIKNPKKNLWSTDKTKDTKKCTCIPEDGKSFVEMINKYGSTNVNENPTTKSPKKSKFTRVAKNLPQPPEISIKQEKTIKQQEKKIPANDVKKLKQILMKLHNEFDGMQKRYEILSKKTEDKTISDEQVKELEILDADLNRKEEEIDMVMHLYEEIGELKRQVQSLKERASKETIPFKERKNASKNSNSTSTAVVHLTKLLEQIQFYQNHYKKN